jgi:hypothetical protein
MVEGIVFHAVHFVSKESRQFFSELLVSFFVLVYGAS